MELYQKAIFWARKKGRAFVLTPSPFLRYLEAVGCAVEAGGDVGLTLMTTVPLPIIGIGVPTAPPLLLAGWGVPSVGYWLGFWLCRSFQLFQPPRSTCSLS